MFHASVLLIMCCLAFVSAIGVFTAELAAPLSIITSFALIVIAFALMRSQRGTVQLQTVACLLFAIGAASVRISLMPMYDTHFTTLERSGVGSVVKEPHMKQERQEVVLRISEIKGDVLFMMPLTPRLNVNDRVAFRCALQQPKSTDDFAYDKYLARHHIGAVCQRPTIESVTPQHTLLQQLFRWKRTAMERLQHTLSHPENGILLGVIFGIDDALPKTLDDAFRRIGATHLLVISGSNVVLLSSMTLTALSFVPVSKRKAILIAVCFLSLYALLTGLQPPAVRATIFGGITLIAMLLGRRGDALRLLVIVATLMLAVNPLLLFYDAGFQLSFLATGGMILFVPLFTKHLQFVPDVFQLRTVLATTLSALIATTPLILHSFGVFAVIALPANMILVPLFEVVMIGGLISLAAALIIPTTIASWLTLPMYYLLHFIIDIVYWFAHYEWASIDVAGVSVAAMAAMYVALGLLAYHVYEQ